MVRTNQECNSKRIGARQHCIVSECENRNCCSSYSHSLLSLLENSLCNRNLPQQVQISPLLTCFRRVRRSHSKLHNTSSRLCLYFGSQLLHKKHMSNWTTLRCFAQGVFKTISLTEAGFKARRRPESPTSKRGLPHFLLGGQRLSSVSFKIGPSGTFDCPRPDPESTFHSETCLRGAFDTKVVGSELLLLTNQATI